MISLELSVDELPSIWRSIIGVSLFQLELGLKDTKVLKYTPSIAAAAAVSNSIQRHLHVMISSNDNVSHQSSLDHQAEISRLRDLVYRIEMALKVSFEYDNNILTLRGMFLDLWRSNHSHIACDLHKAATSPPPLTQPNTTVNSTAGKRGQKMYRKQPFREMSLMGNKQEQINNHKMYEKKTKKLMIPLQSRSARPLRACNVHRNIR